MFKKMLKHLKKIIKIFVENIFFWEEKEIIYIN